MLGSSFVRHTVAEHRTGFQVRNSGGLLSDQDHEFLINDVLCLTTSSGKIWIGFDVAGAAANFSHESTPTGSPSCVQSIDLGPAKKQVILLNFRRPIIRRVFVVHFPKLTFMLIVHTMLITCLKLA